MKTLLRELNPSAHYAAVRQLDTNWNPINAFSSPVDEFDRLEQPMAGNM